MCEISVVMPVYNSGKYVNEAIRSVLAQSFDDFEFIIVDDGSTDNTQSIIHSFVDTQIKFIQNKHDFIGSLNRGMSNTTGKYVARMDADDIMHIDRLKIQHAVMQRHSEITICGTSANNFSNSQNKGRSDIVSGLIEKPILKFIQGNFIIHPTTMIRSNFLRKHSLKYEDYHTQKIINYGRKLQSSADSFMLRTNLCIIIEFQMAKSAISTESNKRRQPR